jgi:nucleoid-associated protein YgaU
MYRKYFASNSQQYVQHHGRPDYSKIDDSFLEQLRTREYIWTNGDTFRKITERTYGKPDQWFLVALVNRKSSDTEVSIGDVILLPISLDEVMEQLNV